jgi:hypothetical protein
MRFVLSQGFSVESMEQHAQRPAHADNDVIG